MRELVIDAMGGDHAPDDIVKGAAAVSELLTKTERIWGLVEGVRRSGFAAVFPTEMRRGENENPFSLILDGGADVIVCSGFVGKVVVKMLEGVAGTVTNLARYAYKENLLWRGGLALLSGGIRRLKEVTDWRQCALAGL